MSRAHVEVVRPCADKSVKVHHRLRKRRAPHNRQRKRRTPRHVLPPAFFTVLSYDPRESVDEIQELTIVLDYRNHYRTTTCTPYSKRILPTSDSLSIQDPAVCTSEGYLTSSISLPHLDADDIAEVMGNYCSSSGETAGILADDPFSVSIATLLDVPDDFDVVSWKDMQGASEMPEKLSDSVTPNDVTAVRGQPSVVLNRLDMSKVTDGIVNMGQFLNQDLFLDAWEFSKILRRRFNRLDDRT